MFIHDALDELITCGETAIRAPDLRAAINTLNEVNPKNAMTKFEEQFKVRNVTPTPSNRETPPLNNPCVLYSCCKR